jgi:hypothetical protein
MIIHTDLKPLTALIYSQILRSRLLIAQSKKLINESQKIIDDETAKRFEEVSAERKRNGSRSGSILPP